MDCAINNYSPNLILSPCLSDSVRDISWGKRLISGVNIREVQQYLGHSSLETTMIYIHVIRNLSSTAESPLDRL